MKTIHIEEDAHIEELEGRKSEGSIGRRSAEDLRESIGVRTQPSGCRGKRWWCGVGP